MSAALPHPQLHLVSGQDAAGLRPMLASPADAPFDSPDYIFEVMWGGVRAISLLDGGRVTLHGRNLRDLTPLYPEVQALAKCFRARHAVLDGEIVAWGAERLPSFDLLRPRLLKPETPVRPGTSTAVIYFPFDVLEVDDDWLVQHPLVERRNILHERLRPHRHVQAGDFVQQDGTAFFEAIREHGLEGMVAKHKASVYLPGTRSDAWIEVRAIRSGDFVIGGYSFGGGRRNDPIGTLLLGVYAGGALQFVGQVSVGCSDREARQLLALLSPLHAPQSPFKDSPQVARLLYWCRPDLACHIRYAGWAANGQLRFPIFVAPRPDVPPEECTRDSL